MTKILYAVSKGNWRVGYAQMVEFSIVKETAKTYITKPPFDSYNHTIRKSDMETNGYFFFAESDAAIAKQKELLTKKIDSLYAEIDCAYRSISKYKADLRTLGKDMGGTNSTIDEIIDGHIVILEKCDEPLTDCKACPFNTSGAWGYNCINVLNRATIRVLKEIREKNKTMSDRMLKVLNFALDCCGEEDCAGDDSVGIPPCPMWQFGDVDESGNVVRGGCMLEAWEKELKELSNGK